MKKVAASIQQETIWLDAIQHSFAYWNIMHSHTFHGSIDTRALKASLYRMALTDTALRTNFVFENGLLYQVIREITETDIITDCITCNKVSPEEKKSIVNREINKLLHIEFDAEIEILFRLSVLQFDETVILLLVINHIISDNQSLEIFWKKLSANYIEAIYGTQVLGNSSSRQYTDYTGDFGKLLEEGALENQKAYWQNKVNNGNCNSLRLPFHDSTQNETRVYQKEILLPVTFLEDIRTCSLRQKLVYSSVFMLPYFIVLHKYSGNKNLQIENMISGRGVAARKNSGVLGHFARTIPVMLEIDRAASLNSLLQTMSNELLSAFANSDYPVEMLARETRPGLAQKNVSAFRPLFNLINETPDSKGLFGLPYCTNDISDHLAGITPEKLYDIVLYIINTGKNTMVRLEVKADLKSEGLVDHVLDTYLTMINQIVYNGEASLQNISLLTNSEEIFLNSVSTAKTTENELHTVMDIFRKQVVMHPDAIAVNCGKEVLSYKQLDEETDGIAQILIEKNTEPGDIIGIYLSRSASLVKVMIAVLKTGAAYLPLDPAVPEARLEHIAGDANVKFTVTDAVLGKKAETIGEIMMIENLATLAGPATLPLQHLCKSSSLAYLIYTSGSAGEPKGVMVAHKALYNFICGIYDELDFAGKKLYSLTSAESDIFALEIFGPLCAGGTVFLATSEEAGDLVLAAEKIRQHSIQVLQCTPTGLILLRQAAGFSFLKNLEKLLVGDESLPEALFAELKMNFRGHLYNLYGSTETTIWSSVKELTREKFVTVGSPLRNTRIYTVDSKGQQQGIGIWGEILIAGEGLANGYCNNRVLTQERFVPDTRYGGFMYKTGDIGRWLPCGNLEIAGRDDEQVKIRGYRVELNEIQYHINTFPGIDRVVVIYSNENGNEELVAYFTSIKVINRNELVTHLKKWLPAYMIPAKFLSIDNFPLNINGKIDKQQLLLTDNSMAHQLHEHNKETERISQHPNLSVIWTAVLGKADDNPVFFDNFFESGGHSLKAVKFLRQVEASTGIKIKVRDFFVNPSIYFVEEKLEEYNRQVFSGYLNT